MRKAAGMIYSKRKCKYCKAWFWPRYKCKVDIPTCPKAQCQTLKKREYNKNRFKTPHIRKKIDNYRNQPEVRAAKLAYLQSYYYMRKKKKEAENDTASNISPDLQP